MNSFLLDDKCEAIIVDNGNGLKTLKLGCGTPVYSQLVKLKLLTFKRSAEYEPADLIDWQMYLANPVLGAVLGTQVISAISSVSGVESVDLSNATYTLNPSPSLKGICFTVNCEKCTVSL